MERKAFEFDGGMVRFTLAGALIFNLIRFIAYMVMLGMVLAVLVLLGFEIAAQSVGFTPQWRL